VLKTLRDYFGGASDTFQPEPRQRIRLSGRGTRIPLTGRPFEVQMGRQVLHLYPDLPADEARQQPPFDYLLFDPERLAAGVAHVLRVRSGEKLDISHRDPPQRHTFTHPRDAFRRHLQVTHEGDALVFRDYVAELGTYACVLEDEEGESRLVNRRIRALEKVAAIFGGPVELLPAEEALALVAEVNESMRQEPYRREDAEGNLGGLLELPPHITPVLVGDLHARLDNLLKILSENAYLESVERGDAALIFLGDAVHPEDDGELESMDSSMLLMDLILKLKRRFPSRVFFIIGNHDSFSPDVMKGGVPQSLLWGKRLQSVRGGAYQEAMDLFYRRSPLVVVSDGFIACHAAPPRCTVTLETLVNIRQSPNIVHDLTWDRIRSPRYPAGYTRRDVRRFRSSLGLAEGTAFIVGHYPRSADETVWLNVDKIEDHHILYSAMRDKLAVFTRFDGEMVAQIYPSEPLLEWLNRRVRTNLAS
jgi:hypothetical protein